VCGGQEAEAGDSTSDPEDPFFSYVLRVRFETRDQTNIAGAAFPGDQGNIRWIGDGLGRSVLRCG
jgi:hypothetical protein